jgi:hypothetical membrane protein
VYASLKPKLFTALLIIAGIANIGLGVFNPDFSFHSLFGLVFLVSYCLAAIFTYKIVNSKPLRYLFTIVGVVGLVGVLLLVSGSTFGLGKGVIGGIAGDPSYVWGIVLGSYLALRKTDIPAKK